MGAWSRLKPACCGGSSENLVSEGVLTRAIPVLASGIQDAPAQEIEFGSPVHTALEELGPIDLSLRLPLAVRQGERRHDGIPVLPQCAWRRP